MFGTMDSDIKFISLICPPYYVGGSLTFSLEESYRSELKVSCLQKFTPKQVFLLGSNLSQLLFLIYVNGMPNLTHHQTNNSEFADDAGQWVVSKNIDLAAKYLQRDPDETGTVVLQMENKIKS